ncbi:cyclin-dependent kinase 7 [Nematocida sp. LUAm3]|nr:cyclin-dependent kinase 7 [Nematocida sp. LUAm3]KAI5174033.1 cyclin-dependent kinase 7 [Nematocida sp. LUAm2]KAI5177224.1 cyclin-dependent kinase 7 [Nematocida sp. LUAm1]
MEKVKRYTREEKIGEGTYAVIFSGKEYTVDLPNAQKQIVTEIPPLNSIQERKIAIKRIKNIEQTEGIDVTTLREIKNLKRVSSEHIIEILDIFEQNNQIHIILPYMESTLEDLIKSKKLFFMPQDVKSWMLMVCKGIYACHSLFIIHRDIKPNNILVSKSGDIKLADFGLSIETGSSIRHMTNQVITRWYKSPEILLGGTNYTFGVDIWALGCLFAELLLRTPYFPGTDDINQLELIFQGLGTPSEDQWPEIKELPGYKMNIPQRPKNDLSLLFSGAGPDAIDLLEKMLLYNPEKRISIEEILSHPYFTNFPSPTHPSSLPFDFPSG